VKTGGLILRCVIIVWKEFGLQYAVRKYSRSAQMFMGGGRVIFFFTARSTTPLNFFTGVFVRWRDRTHFLTFTACILSGICRLIAFNFSEVSIFCVTYY
jgi:hypothetical protein